MARECGLALDAQGQDAAGVPGAGLSAESVACDKDHRGQGGAQSLACCRTLIPVRVCR